MNGLHGSWRRLSLVVSVLLLAGLALSACGAAATATPAPTAAPAVTAAPPPNEAPTAAATEAPTAAATAPAEAATATVAPTQASSGSEPAKLVIWWWGEQEAPGLQKWFDETVDLFKKDNPNVQFETTLQATENVFGDFGSASAAKNPPDLQYFWNGIYFMDFVWQDYVEPLDNIVPADELRHWYATRLSEYEGKQWRAGWYMFGMVWGYNKELFAKANVPAELTPPRTWEDFLKACELLKAAGITPIAMGAHDALLGDWLQTVLMYQNLDGFEDVIRLATGDLKWSDPRYYNHWVRLKELWDKGYINNDVNSLDLYPGIDLFKTGKTAMTLGVGSMIADWEQAVGKEKLGIMSTPAFGEGKWKGVPIIDVQGMGVSAQSQNKDVAARFLTFMHSPARSKALWDEVHVLPADDRFDGSAIDDPFIKQEWEWFKQSPAIYIDNAVPVDITNEAANQGIQQLFNGEISPEELGKKAESVASRWREENPDRVQNYQQWMQK